MVIIGVFLILVGLGVFNKLGAYNNISIILFLNDFYNTKSNLHLFLEAKCRI